MTTITYRVKINSEEPSIALITYKDADGSQKTWLYEKEWEQTVELPGDRQAGLMVSARYLEKEADTTSGDEFERPLVSGEINFNGRVLREDNQKVVSLEYPD